MSSPPPISDDDISERGATSATGSRRRRLAAFIVALVAAALLIRIFMPKPAPAPVVQHYTVHQAETAARNIAVIQKQILGPPRAAAPAAPTSPNIQNTVRLQLSEADLNAYAATDPHIKALLERKGVRAVQILLAAPNSVILRAAINYKGREANLQISGKLVPDAKTMMRLQVASAKIGSVPIPPSTVTTEVDSLLAKSAGPMQNRLPLIVRDIRIENHNLILTGVRQPAKSSERP